MDKIIFPARVIRKFVETLSSDIGQEILSAVLSNAGLPEEWMSPAHIGALDARYCEFKITIGD